MNSILKSSARRGPVVAVLFLAALVSPSSALASLGGDVATVEADRDEMQGSRTISASRSYSVHELKAPTGTVIREFVSPDGIVFAVAWQGPFMPNLRQLLGDYFEPFSEAAQAQRAHRPGRRPMLVQGAGFVVESGGPMRALFGRAYIPDRLPAAMDEGGIQ
ncbi:MAG: DUF2844 domain-containing protein [Vicinamibacteria bacterium]